MLEQQPAQRPRHDGDWSLSQLGGLHLSDNLLDGFIPPEIGNLTKLEDLRLSNNLPNGPITLEIENLSNLSKLEDLHLNYNLLNGHIPPEMGTRRSWRTFA